MNFIYLSHYERDPTLYILGIILVKFWMLNPNEVVKFKDAILQSLRSPNPAQSCQDPHEDRYSAFLFSYASNVAISIS